LLIEAFAKASIEKMELSAHHRRLGFLAPFKKGELYATGSSFSVGSSSSSGFLCSASTICCRAMYTDRLLDSGDLFQCPLSDSKSFSYPSGERDDGDDSSADSSISLAALL
jgi:hypothetical protein